jgi:hypothetical protein
MKTVAAYYGPIPCEILEDDTHLSATNQDPSFRDFLRFVAMRRSLIRAEEYEKLSGIADTEDQKGFFSDMADLKHNEFECLKRHQTDGRIVSFETRSPPSDVFGGEEEVCHTFVTLEDACRFAMKKTLNDYCLYLRLADLEEEIVTKRLFLFLVRMEKCSLNYVQNRLELLTSLHELKGNADTADVCSNYSFEQTA